jgi:hypothetical protein
MTQPVGSASRASFLDLSTSSTSTNDRRSGAVRAREANIAPTPIAGKTAAGSFRRALCALAVSLLVLGTALPSLAGSASVPAAAAAGNTDCTAMAKARITVEPDEAVLTALKGNVHPLARAEFDRGAVADSLPMEHIIMLLERTPEQEVAMQTRIDQMHNQRSPLFHQWLSAERVGACYGVANEDIAVVSQWLQSHGFKIDAVPAGKTVLIFSGTAGQVREAFHTEIHNLEVKGEKHIANMSTPQIPAALAPVIAGFRSLHNFFPKPTMHVAGLAKRNPKTGKSYLEPVGKQPSLGKLSVAKKQPGPDVTYVGSCEDGGTTNCEFLGPQDFYTIYNEKALLTGTSCDGAACNGAGQTIAVIEETDVCNGQASSTPNDCAGADDLTALIPNSAWVPSRSTIISESRQAAIAAIRAFRDRPELARKAKRISTCSGPARWLQARRLTSLPALRPGTRPAWVWPPRMR